MDILPEFRKKSVRSFVIRGGRMTEGQRKAFDDFWPSYGLSLFDGVQDMSQLFTQASPLVVEIGFGMGDSLLEMVAKFTETNFVGVEVHPPGVGRLVNCAGKAELQNLKVYMADANDVMDTCFADNSIDRVQLFFPDPWHKKKHNKRRIVQKPFVDLVARKLKVGGQFHVATDWEPYAEHILEVLSEASALSNTVADYADKPDYRPKTKFENRGEKLGHGVWDLIFEKRQV